MTIPRPTLTIFQKMLVAPLVGVLLYSAFLAYLFEQQQTAHKRIERIRTLYLPVLEIAGGNVVLFDTLAGNFKDAVLAGEMEWVRNTRKEKERIEDSLARLDRYGLAVSSAEVAQVRGVFRRYYDSAYALSLAMLGGHVDAEASNRLIEDVERFHRDAVSSFADLRAAVNARFSGQIAEINDRLQYQVIIAASFGVVLILVILGATFAMSLSTRRSLREVNQAFMNMARDTPDFSRRLARDSEDELGELIRWFNLLADKLEANFKQIELLSITDKLTQLYNRAKIEELFQLELGKARRYGEQLTVILLDVDHFKAVNDSLGHQVGDQVLRDIAEVLRQNVRSTDHVGRWGGEEFVVLLPNTDLKQGAQLAEKLREKIAAFEFTGAGRKTGSLGVATFREGDDADAMTKRADDCLYRAKSQGRDQVVDELMLRPG